MKAYFYKLWVDGSREACKPCTWPRGWRCSCGTWQELKRSRGNQVRQHVRDTACAVLSHFSRVPLLVALGTVACQAPLSLGFSRQEYCSGLPFPSPGDLPDSGVEPSSLGSPASPGGFFTTSETWEFLHLYPHPPFSYLGSYGILSIPLS